MTTNITVHADELRPGDLLEHGGRPHHITDVRRGAGSLWPIAVDGTGWAIALDHRPIRVWRRGPMAVAS